MYKNLKVSFVVPAYNEEKLLAKTVRTLPSFVDKIVIIDDGSVDNTAQIARKLSKSNTKVVFLQNKKNQGLGHSLTKGFRKAKDLKSDLIGVVPGDAQCNPRYISKMINFLLEKQLDYVKANRFMDLEALKQMPRYRRIGNIVITIITKFSTGYYSIFDSQNGYGIFTRKLMEKLPLHMIGKRYDYENTLLTALSIVNARIADYPVPAIYGKEKSTIKFLPTTMRALYVTFTGFWKRIYYKYVLYNFHPIALFLFSGALLLLFGSAISIYITIDRVWGGLSPSSGTVMLAVLPIIVGIQLLLTSIIMDMNNEAKI